MINGFYLYIHDRLETFIYSDIIPRTNDVIEYTDILYNVVTVTHEIQRDKDEGDATRAYRLTRCKIYVV